MIYSWYNKISPNAKRYLRRGIILIFGVWTLVWFFDRYIERSYDHLTYSDAMAIPENEVGLLLGTSKYLASGQINLYYQYRIDAAVELYKAKKIKYILVSGDNSRMEYNEPDEMKRDLIGRGIPSDRIITDYAGLRTLDSVIRSHKIFGQDSVTIISQKFHNKRALFLASNSEINAVAFNAADPKYRGNFKIKWREKLARTKAFIDVIIDTEPRYLGEQIAIE